MNKKEVEKKLEYLKVFRKKIILWEGDNEIQEPKLCILKGWINALIKCLELFSVLFEFYPKSLMEKKGKGINDNLSDLEKVREDLRRRPKLRVKKGRAGSRGRADPKRKAEAMRLLDSKKHKLESQGKREHPVTKRILEEIRIIEKINRQWKDGLITEFQFSETLDRLLLNIKGHQIESKQLVLEDLKKNMEGEK